MARPTRSPSTSASRSGSGSPVIEMLAAFSSPIACIRASRHGGLQSSDSSAHPRRTPCARACRRSRRRRSARRRRRPHARRRGREARARAVRRRTRPARARRWPRRAPPAPRSARAARPRKETNPGNIDGDPGTRVAVCRERVGCGPPRPRAHTGPSGVVSPTPEGGKVNRIGESAKGGGIKRGRSDRLLRNDGRAPMRRAPSEGEKAGDAAARLFPF